MFESTIAGSLPKPSWLAEPNKLWPQWRPSGEELAAVQRPDLLGVGLHDRLADGDLPALLHAASLAADSITQPDAPAFRAAGRSPLLLPRFLRALRPDSRLAAEIVLVGHLGADLRIEEPAHRALGEHAVGGGGGVSVGGGGGDDVEILHSGRLHIRIVAPLPARVPAGVQTYVIKGETYRMMELRIVQHGEPRVPEEVGPEKVVRRGVAELIDRQRVRRPPVLPEKVVRGSHAPRDRIGGSAADRRA